MATSTRYSFLLPLYATLSLASIAVRSRSSVMSSGAVAGPDLRPKNRLKRALEGLIFRLRHRREGDGRVMGVGVGSGKSGPPALNVYILGLEQTLMVDGPGLKEPSPAHLRISGALRRCKDPFYIISAEEDWLASDTITSTWNFLSESFSRQSPRLFGLSRSDGDKLTALKEIALRVPSHARVHYIDGDAETIQRALEEGSPEMKKRWRFYWTDWNTGINGHSTVTPGTTSTANTAPDFLKDYDGTRAVGMDMDEFVELVGTGVIMGYPYTHRNEEYQTS
ncbi:hypothetical protein AAMO2058_000363000 [Amorphochlora amoebiformis]